jgi:putative nucleotidyltransferase with HDIG domain
VVLPEVVALEGIEQPPPHQLDAWQHTLAAVRAADQCCADTGWAAPYAVQVAERIAADAGHGHPRTTFIKLATLLHDIGKPSTQSRDAQGRIHFFHHTEVGAEMVADIARRLRLSGREAGQLAAVVRGHLWPTLLAAEAEVTDRAIIHLVHRLGAAALDALVVARADRGGKAPADDAEGRGFNEVTRRVLDELFAQRERAPDRPLVSGDEIMERYGLEEGPLIGELLDALVEAQLEKGLTRPEEAWQVLDELVGERGL